MNKHRVPYQKAISNAMEKHPNLHLSKEGQDLVNELLNRINFNLISKFAKLYSSSIDTTEGRVFKSAEKAIVQVFPKGIKKYVLTIGQQDVLSYRSGDLKYNPSVAYESAPEYAREIGFALPLAPAFNVAITKVCRAVNPEIAFRRNPKHFLGSLLYRLTDEIARNASEHASNKTSLESKDVLAVLSSSLDASLLGCCVAEANRNLLLYQSGLQEFEPKCINAAEHAKKETLKTPRIFKNGIKELETDNNEEYIQMIYFGTPMIDIALECTTELPDYYGIPVDGCIQATERHEALFIHIQNNKNSKIHVGGSALNSATISKWILGEKGDVGFAGMTGKDHYGSTVKNELDRWGVEAILTTSSNYLTGVCLCLLTQGGHRAMCTRIQNTDLFAELQVQNRQMRTWLNSSKYVFIEGYMLANSASVVRALTTKPGQLLAFSLSAEYICRNYTSELLEILPKVDILFTNESEILAFGEAYGLEGSSTTEVVTSVAHLLKPGDSPRVIIVTRGAASVIMKCGENNLCFLPIPKNVTVVDAVGCGDALAGTFLAVYAITKNCDRAIKAGISAAIKISQVHGCSPPNETLNF